MVGCRYYLQILSLIYTVLIAIIFFTKKIKKTTSSNIFSQLIIVVLLSAIFDIVCVYTESFENKLYNYYFNIAFLLVIVKFILIFTEYITLIVSDESDEEKKSKLYDKIHNFSSVLYIFWTIILIYISNFYASGDRSVANIVIVFYCGISWAFCLGYWIVIMSKYMIRHVGDEINLFKMVKILWVTFFENLFSIAVSIVPGTIGLLVQFFIPSLHVIVPSFTFAVINMYLTIFPIENPDLELAKVMEKVKEEADKANESKTEFLSNVSHEIRTPLNAILGFSQTLLEADINASVKEEVEYIVTSSEALLEIVNEILDISKIESNKLEIVNVDYSPEKIYKSLVTMTQEKIGSSKLQFIHKFSSNIPPILLGDYVRINQIVTNILNNAIKYTEAGFIKLRFECDNITEDNCRLVISVTDSGIGIDDEDFDKIFSKFNGMEIQNDVHIQGTGLGLSLTKRLINMMGGKIVVQSVKGEGSTFTVFINQKLSNLSKLEDNTTENKKETFVGNGQRILIVDDNSVNLKVALRLMKDYNLQIETLTSGKDCLAKINAGRVYDLVMLDDMMPEMNGVETLAKLKENGNYKTTTIALTANAMSGMKEKYVNDGFDDYLAKPIDKKLLDDLLRKYLNNSKSTSINMNIDNKDIDKFKEAKVHKENILDKKIELQDPIEDNSYNEKLNKDFLIKNGVDLDKSMEFLGDMEMYDDTVKDFLTEVDNKLSNIEKFKNESDMPNYAIQVHSLKSDAKYLGLMDLADIAYQHEMASKGNDIEFVNNNFDNLIKLTNEKITLMKKYIG